MNGWIVSDSPFYRKNPDDLAAVATRVAPASRRLSGGAFPRRAGSVRATRSAAERARPSGAKATTVECYTFYGIKRWPECLRLRGSASVDL